TLAERLHLPPFPTRRSSDLGDVAARGAADDPGRGARGRAAGFLFDPDDCRRLPAALDADPHRGPALPPHGPDARVRPGRRLVLRSEEHTSELQSRVDIVCRL